MLPESGSIPRKLTQHLPSTRLQDGVQRRTGRGSTDAALGVRLRHHGREPEISQLHFPEVPVDEDVVALPRPANLVRGLLTFL
jgi:hypothetical protein